MTFPIVGSACAPGILDMRRAAEPGVAPSTTPVIDLLRLFALDDLTAVRRQLVCHWHRDAGGRLACTWELDIVPNPQR
jgi:hypothetical protein